MPGGGEIIVFLFKGVLIEAYIYIKRNFMGTVDNKADGRYIIDTSDRMYKITKICQVSPLPEEGSKQGG
jgi:hypothetical protein